MDDTSGALTEWRPITDLPPRPMAVILFCGHMVWHDAAGNTVRQEDIPPGCREDRCEIGFWDGEEWLESGTGHSMFYERMPPEALPTHWLPLPTPPAGESE